MLVAAAAPHLPGVLHALEPTLNNYGYLAVAGLVLIEDFGVPVPGETVLILAAVYAGSGRLSIALVVLLGFLGAVVGDNIGFAIGHFGGRRLVERWGRYILLTPERLEKATAFFERHGGKVIVIARFVEGLRQANGIVAGTTGMHWARFLAFNALGAALWVGVWSAVGYFSGNNITSIYNTASRYSTYLGIAVGVTIIALIVRHIVRRRRRARVGLIAARDQTATATSSRRNGLAAEIPDDGDGDDDHEGADRERCKCRLRTHPTNPGRSSAGRAGGSACPERPRSTSPVGPTG